jgi:hypothetical protein
MDSTNKRAPVERGAGDAVVCWDSLNSITAATHDALSHACWAYGQEAGDECRRPGRAVEEFRGAIRRAGLTPPEIIADGCLHRFPSNGRPGDDAGWFVLHLDGIPAGCFGDWRTGSSQTWRADIGRDLTPAERAAHQARVDAARRARDAEEERRRAEAAGRAAEILAAAINDPATHPYAIKKRVPFGPLVGVGCGRNAAGRMRCWSRSTVATGACGLSRRSTPTVAKTR